MKRSTVLRLVILAAVMGGLALLAKHPAINQHFRFESLQRMIQNAGIMGMTFFVITFAVGTLLNIPGFLFIIAALLIYDLILGLPLAYFGGLLSVSVHFLVVRKIGGQALAEINRPIVQKAMGMIDRHPIRAVILMRLAFFISPPANYALALSRVRFSDFVIGTVIGMLGPMSLLTGMIYFARDKVIGWIS